MISEATILGTYGGSMNSEQVLLEAQKNLESYMNEENLTADAELQMLSCAYSVLFLKSLGQGPTKEIALAHKTIATCHNRLKETVLAEKHLRLFQAYMQTSMR